MFIIVPNSLSSSPWRAAIIIRLEEGQNLLTISLNHGLGRSSKPTPHRYHNPQNDQKVMGYFLHFFTLTKLLGPKLYTQNTKYPQIPPKDALASLAFKLSK